MPGRITPLITDQIYHVFNRGIDRRPTFIGEREYKRAIETIYFYRFNTPPVKLSKFLRLENTQQDEVLKVLEKSGKLVEIFSYCFMPNHFHFLLKQKQDNGTAKFLSNFQNSYTRYFNIRHKRDGGLFSDQFKAIRIETDEQLIHVSRYIHLNPYTGFVIKSINELENYPWSSFHEYLYNPKIIDKDLIISLFLNKKRYRSFVLNQADFQKELKKIEHLIFE